MYLPEGQEIRCCDRVAKFVNDFGFGALISADLNATHMPFLFFEAVEGKRRLAGHFAKANPHWTELNGKEVLVIFSGPLAYISPSWYAKGPNVPTWNYVAVHMRGILRFSTASETVEVVEQLIQQYEPALLADRNIVTAEYQQRLLAAVVGFEIEVLQVDGREKLGQQRNEQDQQGVYHALSSSSRSDAQALAGYMQQSGIGIGG